MTNIYFHNFLPSLLISPLRESKASQWDLLWQNCFCQLIQVPRTDLGNISIQAAHRVLVLQLSTDLLLFYVGLGFELRVSHLQCRCSTAWATPPVYFALVILEIGSCELTIGQTWPLTTILLISASQVVRSTGVSHCSWHIDHFRMVTESKPIMRMITVIQGHSELGLKPGPM
jgi:hypothetical protein